MAYLDANENFQGIALATEIAKAIWTKIRAESGLMHVICDRTET